MSHATKVRPFARGALLRVVAMVALIGCRDSTGPGTSPPGPVRGLPELLVDSVRTGSVPAGATASFVVAAPTGVPLRVFVHATGGELSDTATVTLTNYGAPGYVWATATSVGTDTSLDDRATTGFTLAESQSVLVTVRGGSTGDAATEYAVVLRATDPHPEQLGASISFDETVSGESIDRYGDVDEFSLSGKAGDEAVVYFQPLPGASGGPLVLELLSPSGSVIRQLVADPRDGELTTLGTDRVPLLAAGTYTVRVAGLPGDVFGGYGPSRGPYRLLVRQVHHAPEGHASRIAVGDTVSESIAGPGDVDDFEVAGTAGQEVELTMRLVSGFAPRSPAGDGEAVTMQLVRGSAVLATVATSELRPSLDNVTSGRVVLPETGDYVVRVIGLAVAPAASAAGEYQFQLYPVDRAPETHAAVIALDSPVSDERVERHGDIDEFAFTAAAGQNLVVFLDAPHAALVVELYDPSGTLIGNGTSEQPTASAPFATTDGIPRIVLPASGEYKVRVSGAANAALYPLPYILEAHAVNTAPEHVSADVPMGTWVTGESIDRRGDVDTFHVEGAPGQLVNVFLRAGVGDESGGGIFLILSPGYPFAFLGGNTGRFTLPASGSITFSVFGDLTGQVSPSLGTYDVLVFPIDSAPEVASPTYVVGDTITTERLDPAGDVDEYVTTLTAGDRLRFVCEAVENGEPKPAYCVFSAAPANANVSGIGANRTDPTLGDFEVPVTGTYRILIASDNDSVTAYRFGLVRLP